MMNIILFNINWTYFLISIAIWLVGFLVDQQFNNCKVIDRTKWYQVYSTAWHYILFILEVRSAIQFFLDNHRLWIIPFLAVLWLLGSFYMGISQHKAAKKKGRHRPWYAVGDGKGNPEENMYWVVTWLVYGFKKPTINRMAIVSLWVRGLLFAASWLPLLLKHI